MNIQTTPADEFIKKIELFLCITINDFSAKRIKGYLDEYTGSLPDPIPITIIKDRIVFRDVVKSVSKKEKVLIKEKERAENYEILKDVSSISGVSVDDIVGKCREAEITPSRQVAMYLMRDINDCTLKKIADIFNRDHTTVMYSISLVRKMIDLKNETYTHLLSNYNELKMLPKKTA